MRSVYFKQAAVVSGMWLFGVWPALAQEASVVHEPAAEAPSRALTEADRRHALILVGLAGDDERERRFRSHAAAWVDWLVKNGTPREQIHVLMGLGTQTGTARLSADRTTIATTVEKLQQRLTRDDALWVFFLGHADYDGQHARFHMPGPDLRDVDFAELFEPIRCKEQIIWLTMSSSGWFMNPLSQPNRIVIAATQADAEPNETEFPDALTDAIQLPPTELDTDHDATVSVLELFAKTVDLVAARYAADQRAATEHAQIDDDGDGRGTELTTIREHRRAAEAIEGEQPFATAQGRPLDGALAAATRLLTISAPPADSPPQLDENQAEVISEQEVNAP